MIKAKEAKAIAQSVELDKQILHEIGFTILKEASQGKYADRSGCILPTTNVDKYYDYLKELGFEISPLYKGEHGVYVVWR